MFRGRFGTVMIAILTILWQSSCSSSKFLKSDEYLLKKNEVIIQGKEKIANKPALRYELSTLYNQKVNNKFFFIPREWVHLKTSPPKEGKKLRSWINRTIGEPPVLFDEQQAESTVKKMQAYLVEQG